MRLGKRARTKTTQETQTVKSSGFSIYHMALKGFSLVIQTAFPRFSRVILKAMSVTAWENNFTR